MSDFSLDIDSSALVQALRSLDNLGDGWSKMVSTVIRENKRMETATNQSIKVQLEAKRRLDEANNKTSNDKWFADQRRRVQMMEASARMEQKAARDAESASARVATAKRQEAAELERLSIKYKEGYASAALYRKMQDEITRAHKLGALSTQQYEAQLESLTQEYTAFQNNAVGASNRFAQAQVAGTKRMSNMGVVTQQVGYQVGDFAVQVQSGQSALVAFSQQATQLVGVLPLMSDQLGMSSGKLIALSAGLGIGIPVVTALAGVLWTTMSAADGAEKEVKSLSDTLNGLGGNLDSLAEIRFDSLGDSLVSPLLEAQQEFQDLLKMMEDAELSALKDKLEAPFKEVLKELESNEYRVNIAAQLGSDTPDFSSEMGLKTREEALFLATQLRTLEGETREELAKQLQSITEALKLRGVLTKEVSETLALIAGEVGVVDLINAGVEGTIVKQEEHADLITRIKGLMGEVSSEATVLTQEVADAAEELGIGYEEALKLQAEMEKAEGFALGITEADMESGIMAAAAQAAILAQNMGISLNLALNLVALTKKTQAENLFDTKVRTGVIPPQAAGDFNLKGGQETPFELQQYMDTVDKRVSVREKAARSGGGRKSSGSGGSVKERGDFVESLKEEMSLREDLLKLFGEERTLQEEINRIVKGLGEDKKKYSTDEISNIAKANLLLKEQEELYKNSQAEMQGIYDTIQSGFEDAFLSVIDGTSSIEDSFKNMARSVISELYKVLVVQRLVGSFDVSGGTGTGLVGALGKFLSFDGGGYTGDSPRTGGVDGKGGFMAVLHPNETVIDHTKGNKNQTSHTESVVIHQSFNFQANGDESVRRIIAQSAPQIANMTQKQILDKRRRGGTMKATFGN